MKKRKKALTLLILTIVLTTLTGCGHQVPSDAVVMCKYEEKKVYLYADEECNIEIAVTVEDENINSFVKNYSLAGETTTEIEIDDIAPGFFTENAEITNVLLGNPTETEYEWYEHLGNALLVVFVLSMIFGR